jgi:hypothetical protein
MDAWARTPQQRLRERRILADVCESEAVRDVAIGEPRLEMNCSISGVI